MKPILALICALCASASSAEIVNRGTLNLTVSDVSEPALAHSEWQRSTLNLMSHGMSGRFSYLVGVERNEYDSGLRFASIDYTESMWGIGVGRYHKSYYELTNSSQTDVIVQPVSASGRYYTSDLFNVDGVRLWAQHNMLNGWADYTIRAGELKLPDEYNQLPSLISEAIALGGATYDSDRVVDFTSTYVGDSTEVIFNAYRLYGSLQATNKLGVLDEYLISDYSDFVSLSIDHDCGWSSFQAGVNYYRFNVRNKSPVVRSSADFRANGWYGTINVPLNLNTTVYASITDSRSNVELEPIAVALNLLFPEQSFQREYKLGITHNVTNDLTVILEHIHAEGTAFAVYDQHKPVGRWHTTFLSFVYRFNM